MPIQQNQFPAEPELKDYFDLHKREIFLDFNCHAIGQIQIPNYTNQTAVVSISYKKTYFEPNPITGVYTNKLVDYPLLADCPVICLGGGNGALTFPYVKGDDCLVFFNDRDLDNWFQGSTTSGVASPRMHSISDAVVIVGLRPLGRSLADYDAARVVLKNGPNARMAVAATRPAMEYTPSGGEVSVSAKVKIANTAAGTLGPLLQNLTTQLTNLTTALAALTVTGVTTGGGTSGPPSNAAAISTIGTNISSIATQLSGLLE